MTKLTYESRCVIYVATIVIQWIIILPIGYHRTIHHYVSTLNLTGKTQCSYDDDDLNYCVCLYGFQNTLKSCVEATYYSNDMCDVIVDATTGSCTEYQTHTAIKQVIPNNMLVLLCIFIIPVVSAPIITITIECIIALYYNSTKKQEKETETIAPETTTYNQIANSEQV